MVDNALPTGPEFAARLHAQGLAPVDVSYGPIYYDHGDGRGRVDTGERACWIGAETWMPWSRIDHCWYLVELLGLSIDFHLETPRPEGSVRPKRWWVGERGLTGVVVHTFAEVPTAICQAALRVAAWRTG